MALLCTAMSLTTPIAKDVACRSVFSMWKNVHVNITKNCRGHMLTSKNVLARF